MIMTLLKILERNKDHVTSHLNNLFNNKYTSQNFKKLIKIIATRIWTRLGMKMIFFEIEEGDQEVDFNIFNSPWNDFVSFQISSPK